MKAQAWGWARRTGHTAWLSGVLVASMAVNDDNGCDDAQPQSAQRAECSSAAECSGDPNIDCLGDWQCVQGFCEFQCDGPVVVTGCGSDAECDAGLVCVNSECVRAEEPLPEKCRGSEECAAGEYCTTETGDCQSVCDPGEACPPTCWGDCVPKERPQGICYGDLDCAYGEFCDREPCVFPDGATDADRIACGGVCAPAEGCSSDAQCAAGEVCTCAPWPAEPPPNGLIACFMSCQPATPVCNSDAECWPGTVCQNGACVEPQRECYSNDQCPLGWSCAAQCDGGGSGGADGATPESDPAMPYYCPSYCVPPQGEVCADGQVCAPGESCQQWCATTCYDGCDCAEGQDCNCCWEECKWGCAPSQTGCQDDSQCPAGTHCGCANSAGVPEDGLWCDLQCIRDEAPAQCWADYECGDGYYCDFSGCAQPTEPCDPSSGAGCGDRPGVASPGSCQPKQQPAYDCKSDESCISADGRQGWCEYYVCEGWAVPCENPDDPNCGQPQPEPVCYGYCRYDQVLTCDPNVPDSCPWGTHCEASSNCGTPDGGAGFMPCLAEYQCVPDRVACESDCDCDPALACNAGVCERMGRINTCGLTDCTSDADCQEGEVCHIDPTQPVCDCAGCPCSIPHGTCGPDKEVRTCSVDSECLDGEYCGCGPDPSCPMCAVCLFQCLPKPLDGNCASDADCGEGQTCTFYYPPCAPPPDGFEVPPDYCQPIGVCEQVEPPPPPPPQACQVTGCSGTICAAANVPVDTADNTTCEWFDWYKCYTLAICDIGADGACGWQKTDDFVACMAQFAP